MFYPIVTVALLIGVLGYWVMVAVYPHLQYTYMHVQTTILYIFSTTCIVSFLDRCAPSFLVTATEPTYAVIMNGSVVGEPDGVNISEYGLTLVTNGTACDPTVSATESCVHRAFLYFQAF